MAQTPRNSGMVTQVFPQHRQIPLIGLYLGQRLAAAAEQLGSSLVITNFITDQNGVIAKADQEGHLQVPAEIKNDSDWRLFQELLAQADVMISSSSYFRRVAAAHSRAQNVLSQFEPGGEFAELGQWRLENGYPKRSPDLAVVTRSLNFQIPAPVLSSDRRTTILTTNAAAGSTEAQAFKDAGAFVVGCGATAIDGRQMIDWLRGRLGYRVIMMTAGPGILQPLLEAQRLDYFYVTEAQREVVLERPSAGRTLLPNGAKVAELSEFRLAHRFIQKHVVAEDGSLMEQVFLRYDRKVISEETSLR